MKKDYLPCNLLLILSPMKIHIQTTIYIQAAPETVFSAITTPHSFPPHFRGYGSVPGILQEVLPEKATRYEVGMVRKMYMANKAVLSEKITEFEYPNLFAYEIISGISRPLSLLVSSGRSVWNCLPHKQGTILEWHYVFTITSFAAYPAARFFVKFFMKRAMESCLHSIKTSLEKQVKVNA